MDMICIRCPMGCALHVEMKDGQVLSVSGNTCKRGETYAKQECVEPRRMVTAVVPVEGSACPLSVKTADPIPKAQIAQIMQALSNVRLKAPIRAGDVVVPDICGTGVDIIATRSLE